MLTKQLILAKCEHIQKMLVEDSLKLARNYGIRAMTKAVLTLGLLFCLSAAAMAQTNISNTRDGNGNLISPQHADEQHPTHDQLNDK
jgi:hypothetical protein